MDSLTLYRKIFGEMLRIGRDSENLTVEEISEKVGISPGTYRNLESGQRIPTITQIEGFAELFKSSFSEFIDTSLELFGEELKKRNLETKEYGESIKPVFKLAYNLEQKWKKEKAEIAGKGNELAEDLIRIAQRYYTPNKYLSKEDIDNLTEEIMTLTDLRVQQILRKRKKA